MTKQNVASPLFRCALGIVFLALFASASSAGAIYEYRELGSTVVIGTLEITAPPASIDSGWTTVDPSNLISLFLDDAVFGLGNANLLLAGGAFSGVDVTSNDGSTLDSGGVGIIFPTIIPPNPDDPTIDQTLVFAFDVLAGADFIGLASVFTFPDNSVVIGDLFSNGDWTAVPDAAVPEPGTFALLGMGLLAAGRSALRRRSSSERRQSYSSSPASRSQKKAAASPSCG